MTAAETSPLVRVGPSAVALETAFLTSGLPPDVRSDAVKRMSDAVESRNVDAAFVGVIGGRAIVGLAADETTQLARQQRKLSTRDLPVALARGQSGGTTVAATISLARQAHLQVAATGGIGGVHPAPGAFDVSADLFELARTPIVLVCSGAKAIVDLPATLERLETLGVMVVGFGTDELPAFYSAESGLPLDVSVEKPDEVADIWAAARSLAPGGALMVCVPPPADVALSRKQAQEAVSRALSDLDMQGISGPAVTPFLLARIAHHTEGRSLTTNLGLLENNAGVAADIVRAVREVG